MEEDIHSKLWHDPWKEPGVADQQLAAVQRELADWKSGKRHEPFDAYCMALKQVGFFRTILEVGCGCGYYSEMTRTVSENISFTGVDVSLAMLMHARRQYPDATWIQGNAQRLLFESNAFEVVCLSGVLGHVSDPEKAIGEAVRVSSRWVVLHRVGCSERGDTRVKQAYGVTMAERYFCERELLALIPGDVQLPAVRWNTDFGYQISCAIDLGE